MTYYCSFKKMYRLQRDRIRPTLEKMQDKLNATYPDLHVAFYDVSLYDGAPIDRYEDGRHDLVIEFEVYVNDATVCQKTYSYSSNLGQILKHCMAICVNITKNIDVYKELASIKHLPIKEFGND